MYKIIKKKQNYKEKDPNTVIWRQHIYKLKIHRKS